VLPARALAKISCRLVPNQNPRRVYEQVSGYIQAITPPTVRVETRLLAEAFPAVTDLNAPVMAAAARAFEMGWGAAPSFERGGGTLPILADFQRELGGLPVILMGFGLITDGAHGPNEHFSIDMFHKGIASAIHLVQETARR
jgi:acetylornithine deacetylase/succinyl-diaminopimelate desuccinylase-like protein